MSADTDLFSRERCFYGAGGDTMSAVEQSMKCDQRAGLLSGRLFLSSSLVSSSSLLSRLMMSLGSSLRLRKSSSVSRMYLENLLERSCCLCGSSLTCCVGRQLPRGSPGSPPCRPSSSSSCGRVWGRTALREEGKESFAGNDEGKLTIVSSPEDSSFRRCVLSNFSSLSR